MSETFWQYPAATFILTVLLTVAVKPVLRHLGFWNAKDSEHNQPVVRGGGIAVALALLSAGYGFAFLRYPALVGQLNRFLPAALMVLVTGIIDDRWGIRAQKKLLLQALAMLALWLGGYRIHYLLGWHLGDFSSIMLTVFWGVSVLNAFNLIDGLDGLCTGNAMIAAGAFLAITALTRNREIAFFSLLLGGACAGFLVFNFHPAKIFLGDTGSLFLGLTCTALSLRASGGYFNITNTAVLLLIFWIPFCDMGLAVWRRKVKALLKSSGCEIMERDMYHTHYRLKNMIHSHTGAVLIMWFGMVSFDFFALLIFIMATTKFTLLISLAISLFTLLTMARYELSYSICYFRHTMKRSVQLWR
ncbi:MAG: undecaprenyl/decaprenyl-phosphate alpha-N-acetylglucosaminyl 1-phosphate transferase [Lentisphaeria bacterium]|nr:undecaprenyl/decaprenyl-phosphate alpha-N-acetylglucosaminyl 1-phosphate transferase [Lentisphaeria bacterium]